MFACHKCWYDTVVFFKAQLVNFYERKLKHVPEMIQHLDKFKLRHLYDLLSGKPSCIVEWGELY